LTRVALNDLRVTPLETASPPAFSESTERKTIFLLCVLAAIHIFIFSAAFPFFNNVDEQFHFDLVVKYSHGDVPHGLETVSDESVRYIVLYGSLEYFGNPTNFPDGKFPPPPWTWPQTNEKIRNALLAKENAWRSETNHECSQPPLYYALAGLWWRLGQACGFHNGFLLYWLRFLNVIFVAALVWLGYAAARIVLPGNLFLRIGVPALITFIPQTIFYSVNNDVLSPLCFGAAFVLLVKSMNMEIPGVRLGAAAGLALAATFLGKISNLPLLAVAGAVVSLKFLHLLKAGKLRAALPSLIALALCALSPMAVWLAWTKHYFGDFTGSAAKIQFLGWTHKPFAEWRHHPIFTPHGFWIFIHDLLSTFWQGEFLWHLQPLAFRAIDMIYAISSVVAVIITVIALLPRFTAANAPQRQALWFGFCCFIAAISFLAFLSIIYDFHNCFYPSREHPYFTSGRLMLGALIPFLLLFVHGLDYALKKFGNRVKFLILGAMILFMLASEIIIDWPVFSNEYNWFHL
jgi:hypothetical protein